MGNKVIIGGTEIAGVYLLSGQANTTHAMVGETLAADQFSCEVNTADVPFVPADQEVPLATADDRFYYVKNPIDVTSFKDGDEVFCYSDETLVGKYFFEELTQTGANRYRISAVSIIGRLLDSKHYGGIYVQVPAATILADILGDISYSVDPSVAAATVTGYLPIASRRDNLQQLLAVTGATVKVDNTGAIDISPMSDVSTGVFDGARCYENGQVTTTKPVAGVKVTEHNYFPAGNAVTLFEDGLDGTETIEFNEPYHDLAIEGGTIIESGANYAKIEAKGTVTLTGQPYTHVTRIVTAGTISGNSTENVKSVSSCYLANPQVAQSIADRMYSFLKCNTTISQGVLLGTERAGDVVSVINPYTMEMQTATIKKMDITLSGRNKANAEFLASFVPSGVISGFTSYEMLTGSGVWNAPDDVTKIRIILVGGGSGGDGGANGSEGGKASTSGSRSGGSGGKGGKGGDAGAGGKVFEISLDVSPGAIFPYACGSGGTGGAVSTDGVAGAETTFGGYSSDYGRLYPYGYYEAKTGLTLAAAGMDGYDGGAGGDGSPDCGSGGERGKSGESVQTYTGGAGGYCYTNYIDADGRHFYDYGGAGGGGAAYGANGGAASNTTPGVGASASAGANGTNPGQGGSGGHGGGGGGGGALTYYHNAFSGTMEFTAGNGGAGGNGAKGGSGAAGAIIIYY